MGESGLRSQLFIQDAHRTLLNIARLIYRRHISDVYIYI